MDGVSGLFDISTCSDAQKNWIRQPLVVIGLLLPTRGIHLGLCIPSFRFFLSRIFLFPTISCPRERPKSGSHWTTTSRAGSCVYFSGSVKRCLKSFVAHSYRYWPAISSSAIFPKLSVFAISYCMLLFCQLFFISQGASPVESSLNRRPIRNTIRDAS